MHRHRHTHKQTAKPTHKAPQFPTLGYYAGGMNSALGSTPKHARTLRLSAAYMAMGSVS